MKPAFLLPPRVARGARVRVVATSWAVDGDRLEAGLEALRALDLEPVLPRNLHGRRGFFAGDDAARGAAFDEALDDASAPVLWVAQGGSGATRLLPALDTGRVSRAGKWLVGFSDATALHGVWARAGLASLHGPNLTTLPRWSAAARAEVGEILRTGRAPALAAEAPLDLAAPVAGPLLGGNLSVLAAMVGTPSFPALEGGLLLLEDVDEATHRLDRMATQLVQAGALEGVRAVLLGQFTRCRPSHGDDAPAEAVLADALAALGLPVARGLAVGHERTARPVVLGAPYALHPDGRLVPRFGPDAK